MTGPGTIHLCGHWEASLNKDYGSEISDSDVDYEKY